MNIIAMIGLLEVLVLLCIIGVPVTIGLVVLAVVLLGRKSKNPPPPLSQDK